MTPFEQCLRAVAIRTLGHRFASPQWLGLILRDGEFSTKLVTTVAKALLIATHDGAGPAPTDPALLELHLLEWLNAPPFSLSAVYGNGRPSCVLDLTDPIACPPPQHPGETLWLRLHVPPLNPMRARAAIDNLLPVMPTEDEWAAQLGCVWAEEVGG